MCQLSGAKPCMRLPSFSVHPICADRVAVREDGPNPNSSTTRGRSRWPLGAPLFLGVPGLGFASVQLIGTVLWGYSRR